MTLKELLIKNHYITEIIPDEKIVDLFLQKATELVNNNECINKIHLLLYDLACKNNLQVKIVLSLPYEDIEESYKDIYRAIIDFVRGNNGR